MPVWLYFSSFLIFFFVFFFEQEPIYTIRVVAVFYSYYRRPVSLQSNWEWKPSTLGMFISFPFLKIFLSAHVIITEITAFGMFTNLCLVLLLVRADSLIPKFQFQLMKKTGEKSRKWWKFVFTWHFENKMLNARIWRRKAAKSTGTWTQEHEDCSGWQRHETQLLWKNRPSTPRLEKKSKQALNCSLEGRTMQFLRLASLRWPDITSMN